MTAVEREILSRFFPPLVLDALSHQWIAAAKYPLPWCEGEGEMTSFLNRTDRIKTWTFFTYRNEFSIGIYPSGLGGERALGLHGPWSQRFQGLITMIGAYDVLEARRDTSNGNCVHAHT